MSHHDCPVSRDLTTLPYHGSPVGTRNSPIWHFVVWNDQVCIHTWSAGMNIIYTNYSLPTFHELQNGLDTHSDSSLKKDFGSTQVQDSCISDQCLFTQVHTA